MDIETYGYADLSKWPESAIKIVEAILDFCDKENVRLSDETGVAGIPDNLIAYTELIRDSFWDSNGMISELAGVHIRKTPKRLPVVDATYVLQTQSNNMEFILAMLEQVATNEKLPVDNAAHCSFAATGDNYPYGWEAYVWKYGIVYSPSFSLENSWIPQLATPSPKKVAYLLRSVAVSATTTALEDMLGRMYLHGTDCIRTKLKEGVRGYLYGAAAPQPEDKCIIEILDAL